MIRFEFATFFDYYEILELWKAEFGYDFCMGNFIEDLNRRNIRLLTVRSDDRIIGTLRVEKRIHFYSNEIEFLLTNVAIHKVYRGLGIGTRLFQILEELCFIEGGDYIDLTCANFRAQTHKFYISNKYSKKYNCIY